MRKPVIIYKEAFCEKRIIKNKIIEQIGKPGVWALYGKKDDKSKFMCLNVGKCQDIGREIIYDLGCLHFLPIRNKMDQTQKYINQFGDDCGFNTKSGWTQEILYPRIRKDYNAIAFVKIHDKSSLDFESSFAWKTQAKFWRNGGIFKNNRQDYYEECLNECEPQIEKSIEDLIRLIDEELENIDI